MAKDAPDGETEQPVHPRALDPGFHQLVDAGESIEHVATVGGKERPSKRPLAFMST